MQDEKNIQDVIIKELFTKQDLKYKKFHSSLVPNINKFIGVRVPVMREIAKKIVSSGNALIYINSIPDSADAYYEQTMIYALIIGHYKCDTEEKLELIAEFLPRIDNWAVCDVFCASLKFTAKNYEAVWNFLNKYTASEKEYEMRFAIVMMLDYYINDKYINKVLQKIDKIKREEYYVRMAIAWCISICYIKYPGQTLEYLKRCGLCDFTYNKALSKITESLRVSAEDKEKIKKMRRK